MARRKTVYTVYHQLDVDSTETVLVTEDAALAYRYAAEYGHQFSGRTGVLRREVDTRLPIGQNEIIKHTVYWCGVLEGDI